MSTSASSGSEAGDSSPVRRRLSTQRLGRVLAPPRATLRASKPTSPPEQRPPPPQPPRSRVELSRRIGAIERMAEALERRSGPAAAQRFSFHCRSARHQRSPTPAPSPARMSAAGVQMSSEDEQALATASLGAPAAMERLLQQAATSNLEENELERAVESLAQYESRAAAALHNAVDELKATFRSRLERLEAAFVAQADAIRDELTRQVRAQKVARAAEVAAHADELCAAMARRSGLGSLSQAGRTITSKSAPNLRSPEHRWSELPGPTSVNPTNTERPSLSPAQLQRPRLDLDDERDWWGTDDET